MQRFLYNDPRVPAFVAKSVGSDDCKCYASFGVLQQDVPGGGPPQIVAGVVYDNYTSANIFVHFTVAPGHRIGRNFLRLIFGYAFDYLKVKRITGAVSAANGKVRRFAEQLGFSEETRLKDAFPDGDMVFFRMTRSTCRHLPKVRPTNFTNHTKQLVQARD